MTNEHPDMQPVFVLGNPRSGTTMLRLMLTSHQDISIPPESEFIVRLFTRFGHLKSFSQADVAAMRTSLSGDPIDLAEQWEVPLQDLFPSERAFVGMPYAMLCASIYRAYQDAKGLAPTRFWGDKNNAYGQYVDLLTSLYPSARFIHMVRDGRAVLNSYRKLSADDHSKYAPILPKDPREVALRWADTTSRIERHLRRYAANRSIRLRYEDLLADPEVESRRLCDFLGLSYDPGMLEFHIRNNQQSLEPKKYGWKANTFRPLDKKKSSCWQEELSYQAIEEFEFYASSILREHGYELITLATGRGSRSLSFSIKAGFREVLRHIRLKLVRIRSMVGV